MPSGVEGDGRVAGPQQDHRPDAAAVMHDRGRAQSRQSEGPGSQSPCRGGVGISQVHLERGVGLTDEQGQRGPGGVDAAQRRPDRLRGARSGNEREADRGRRGWQATRLRPTRRRRYSTARAATSETSGIDSPGLDRSTRSSSIRSSCSSAVLVANPHQSQSVDGCRQRDDHLGRERVARKGLDWDAADERARRQQLRSSRVESRLPSRRPETRVLACP